MSADSVHLPHMTSGAFTVMGIVNVTPDSFSDGGKFLHIDKAIEQGLKLIQEGADILDIGGESTRPGAQAVDPEEEMRRVIPVIEALRGRVKDLSVDTRNAVTMKAAMKAGANIINDISALRHDPDSIDVIRESDARVILMHMQGVPEEMQNNPLYNNVIDDILHFLKQRTDICRLNRIDIKNLVIDPGIGFGKTLEQNVLILRNINRFLDLDVPVMLGASRKSFIAKLSKDEAPLDRLPGSLASVLYAYDRGVRIFRVHDVKETIQALKVHCAICP